MTGEIYFVKCGDRIKIGHSNDLQKRMKALQTSSAHPLELIASHVGSVGLERAIHAHLAAHRTHGEWFYDCTHVRAVISEVVLRGGEAIGFQERLTVKRDHMPVEHPEIEPLPDISDTTLGAIKMSIIECKSIACEIERRTSKKEDVSDLLARLEFLTGVIGPALFPHSAQIAR